jgi:lysophospholipase L1-like esterase
MKRLILGLAACALLSICQAASAAPEATSQASTDPYWPANGIFPGKGRTSSWPGFHAKNTERRALFAQHVADEQGGVVFVGDSITEGWHTLAQDLSSLNVKVVNRGIGGDTTPNLLYRLDADVLSLHPRALVVLVGTNDLGEHTPPADIAENLEVFLRRVRSEYPHIPIAWCLVMPRGGGDTYPERIGTLNHLIVKMADSDPNITICDTFTPLALADGTSKPEDFNRDRLHPNAAGYVEWKGAVLPILAKWGLHSSQE